MVENRYANFGLMRLLLALAVVVWHVDAIAPIGGPLASALKYGVVAVFVFFILSGYIICEAGKKFYLGRPGAFLTNRLVRLYPQYLLALLLAVLIVALPPYGLPAPPEAMSATNILKNILSIVPIAVAFGPRFDFISIVWAIRVEFAFYLVVFLALAASVFLKRKFKWGALACAGFFLAAHIVLIYAIDVPAASFYASFVPMFVIGAGASFLARPDPASRTAWRLLCGAALPLALVQVLVYPAYFITPELVALHWQSGHWAAATLFLALLAAAFVVRRSGGGFHDQWAGELSYIVYLIHLPVITVFQKYFPESIANVVWVPCFSMVAAFAFAALTEPPLLRMRQFIRRAKLK